MISPFKINSNIQIRLIRDLDESSQDDRICIAYKGEDTYHLFYQDACMKTPTPYRIILTGVELDTYFESLFTLLSNDRIPFDRIQFDIPCCPSMIYSIKDINSSVIRNALMKLMPLCKSCDTLTKCDSCGNFNEKDTSSEELETIDPSSEYD